LNPDELLWSYVKRTGTAKRPLASGELLQDRIEADLLAVQANRPLVRSFFKAPSVAYITDWISNCPQSQLTVASHRSDMVLYFSTSRTPTK
jgi:hypothetical protein